MVTKMGNYIVDEKQVSYKMEKFTDEEITSALKELGINTDNYIFSVKFKWGLMALLIIILSVFVIRGSWLYYIGLFCIYVVSVNNYIICAAEDGIYMLSLSKMSNKTVNKIYHYDMSGIKDFKTSSGMLYNKISFKFDKKKVSINTYKKVRQLENIDQNFKRFQSVVIQATNTVY